jgi:hypothetical protein
MKTRSLFLISLVSLAICACTNPLMDSLLKSKTIFFDSNGGSYVPPQTLLKNEKISEPRAPVKEGYYFSGWYYFLDDDYYSKNNLIWDFNDIPEGDMTLYAMWDEKPTPTKEYFIITGAEDFEYDGKPKEVTVSPQEGIIVGKISVYYEDSNNTIYGRTSKAPINPGTYWVTFDVAATEDWKAVRGLFAGTLKINVTPTASDFNISNLTQFQSHPSFSNISAVTITPKDNKYSVYVTVYYEGTNGTTYVKNTTKPSTIGSYNVTFNVTADTNNNWNAAYELFAGTLEINVFKSIDELGEWLREQLENYDTNPYPVVLNVSDLGVSTSPEIISAAGSMLKENDMKYVSLDLSGSSFNSIGNNAFWGCMTLTGITIPDNVNSIGNSAFEECENLNSVIIGNNVKSIGNKAFFKCDALTSVTFRGTIPSDEWPPTGNGNGGTYVFPDDLREKYLGTAGTTVSSGGPGTYMRTSGDTSWTKQ